MDELDTEIIDVHKDDVQMWDENAMDDGGQNNEQSNDTTGSSSRGEKFDALNHIKAIDKNVVHRICSGQVVVTLATAVKELVENSIDAGATSIDIRLVEFGSKSVEVTDNGSGVPENDFEGLGLKHHTSKIQQFEDLTFVETFGFRGEALSSLCALSDLTVITKAKPKKMSQNVVDDENESRNVVGQSQGFRIEFDHKGRIKQKNQCAREFGTTVVLKNLFSTLPVRHNEFIKNLKKEFNKMVHILYGYCLISTGVRISCTNQMESGTVSKILSIPASNTTREKIVSLFGSKSMETLMEIEEASICNDETILTEFGLTTEAIEKENPFKFSGFISLPFKGRSSSDRQFLFINSRPCESGKISRIVNSVYHGYSKNSRYPFVFLHIQTEQQNVDVNITPDKRQIYLRNEKILYASIKTTLTSLLSNATASFNTQIIGQDIRTFSQSSQRSSSDQEDDSPSNYSQSEIYDSSENLFSLNSSQSDRFRSQSQEDEESEVTIIEHEPKPKENQMRRSTTGIKFGKNSTDLSARKTENNASSSFNKKDNPNGLREFLKRFEYRGKSSFGKTTPAETSQSSHPKKSDPSFKSPKKLKFRSLMTNYLKTSPPKKRKSDDCYDEDENDETLGQENEEETEFVHPQRGYSTSIDSNTRTNVIVPQKKDAGTRPCSSHQSIRSTSLLNKKKSLGNGNVVYDDELEENGDVRNVTIKPKSKNDTPCSFQVYGNAKVVSISVNWSEGKKKNTDRLNHVESREEMGRRFRAKISADDNKQAETELRQQLTKDMFEQMKIIGQFNNGFIIVKYGPDIFIIDQHATDEKYNYEELEKNLTLQSQRLIRPINMELPAASILTLIDRMDVFRKNGFDFLINEDEEDCTQKVQMVKIPYYRSYEFGKDDIDELLFLLGDAPENAFYRPSKVREMLASRACKQAVKIGDVLNLKGMRSIVDHMGLMEQPWNCPHGRPTIRHLFNLNMLPDSQIYKK